MTRRVRAMPGQLDLFGADAERPADTRRLADGLTCLRDAVGEAMDVVLALEYEDPADSRSIHGTGEWVYSIRRGGIHYERRSDWWTGARERGEPWGWHRTPAHRISWAELAGLVGGDARRADLIAWAVSLPEPSWRDRMRPYELWPRPGQWNPDYIRRDRERPGWDARIAAWRTLQAILTDAITRLDPAGGDR